MKAAPLKITIQKGGVFLTYAKLRAAALLLIVLLFLVLSKEVRQEAQPVMVYDEPGISMEAVTKSISRIITIEYRQIIKTSGNEKDTVEMHYYYRRPGYLRTETKSRGCISIDIYTPSGMYEYFPQSNTAYYREKWKDDKPISFQLEDKIADINISGKYEYLREESISGMECEVIRRVDQEEGSINEHRIWIGSMDNLKLPVREEYLTDGEEVMVCEYQYISVNREIPNSIFELKASADLKVYNIEGIPKTVKDEKEAEKYIGFDMVIPQYLPSGFEVREICVIPPAKSPAVLVTYLSDMDTIYLNEKKTEADEFQLSDNDKIVNAGGRKFAVRKMYNDSISVRWIGNHIEFEVSGPYNLKGEIVKIVHSMTKLWIPLN